LALTPRGRTGRALWSESVWRYPYLLGFRRKNELGPYSRYISAKKSITVLLIRLDLTSWLFLTNLALAY